MFKSLKNQLGKIGTGVVMLAMTGMAMAAEDAAIITAVSGGITDAGDTNKAIYMLLIGAAILVMAAAWAFSTIQRKGKG